MADISIESLEGRLLAQRKLLALMVAELTRDGRGEGITRLIEEGSVVQDGQEDPGAVPSGAVAIEAALADELRLIGEAARRHAG